ncbi:hypothetical protein WN943_021919 [Citrus x changshan-huyou]
MLSTGGFYWDGLMNHQVRMMISRKVGRDYRNRGNQVELRSKLLHEVSLHKVTGITNAQADIEISFETTVLEKAEVLEPSRTNPQLLCSHKSASVKVENWK